MLPLSSSSSRSLERGSALEAIVHTFGRVGAVLLLPLPTPPNPGCVNGSWAWAFLAMVPKFWKSLPRRSVFSLVGHVLQAGKHTFVLPGLLPGAPPSCPMFPSLFLKEHFC